MKKPISNVFLTYASEIIAATNGGLSGSQIGKYFSAKSIDLGIDIPHHKPPFTEAPNKRTAFLENLQKFNSQQQFEILNQLIEEYQYIEGIIDLKNKLHSQYPEYLTEESKFSSSSIVKETKHWLQSYNKPFELYNSALEKLDRSQYQRNLIDDLRLSLELLLKEILQNDKPIEKQIPDLGLYQKNMGISSEATNMFHTLLDYYSKYQNKYIKHDDNVNIKEIEFIFDLSSTFMKFITKH